MGPWKRISKPPADGHFPGTFMTAVLRMPVHRSRSEVLPRSGKTDANDPSRTSVGFQCGAKSRGITAPTARSLQFALLGVPVLLEIDYKLVAKMTKRLLECVCRQVSAEGFQRLGLLPDRLAIGAGLTIPDPIARSTQRETAGSISSDGTTSLAIKRPSVCQRETSDRKAVPHALAVRQDSVATACSRCPAGSLPSARAD